MIKFFATLIAMVFAFNNANAQFARGYGPGENTAPQAEQSQESSDEQSPLFRTPTQAPKPVAPPKPEVYKIPTPYKGSIRILASINGDIITTEDINNRVRAFCLTTGIPFNEQTRLLIINKVMQSTIDEKLKLQEAERNQIEISKREIDNAVITFQRNNNIAPTEFKKILKKAGVSEEVFREQIKTDLAWTRVVRRKSGNDTVTQLEVQDAMSLAKKDLDKNKYMLLEIVINKKDAKNIDELVQNLRQDPRFELYASQFSQSPSTSSGGRLGWVNEGQLPEILDNAVKKLSDGGVSNPILIDNKYHILKVEKKFDPSKGQMPNPTSTEIENMLLNQKSERVSSQLMQNLRQKATIEMRE